MKKVSKIFWLSLIFLMMFSFNSIAFASENTESINIQKNLALAEKCGATITENTGVINNYVAPRTYTVLWDQYYNNRTEVMQMLRTSWLLHENADDRTMTIIITNTGDKPINAQIATTYAWANPDVIAQANIPANGSHTFTLTGSELFVSSISNNYVNAQAYVICNNLSLDFISMEGFASLTSY